MTKVDILLPYWGDVELLKKAVKSVLAQTEQDWRLLVFDDCYPSKEPAKYFKKLGDDRVLYKRHAKNIGITNNFNFSVQAAKAKYCVLFGCDDILLPNYLETALANIGEADFYQPNVDVIDEQGNTYLPLGDKIKRLLRPRKAGVYSGQKLAASLCHGNWLYFPSILWKTATIQRYGFDAKYSIVQDVNLELGLIKGGGTLYLDNQTTFQYRRFAKSVSSVAKKDGKRFNEETAVYDKFVKEFKAVGWRKAARACQLHFTSRLHHLITR